MKGKIALRNESLVLGGSGKVLKSGRGQFESGTEGQGAGLSKTQDQGRSHVLGSGFVSGRED